MREQRDGEHWGDQKNEKGKKKETWVIDRKREMQRTQMGLERRYIWNRPGEEGLRSERIVR